MKTEGTYSLSGSLSEGAEPLTQQRPMGPQHSAQPGSFQRGLGEAATAQAQHGGQQGGPSTGGARGGAGWGRDQLARPQLVNGCEEVSEGEEEPEEEEEPDSMTVLFETMMADFDGLNAAAEEPADNVPLYLR